MNINIGFLNTFYFDLKRIKMVKNKLRLFLSLIFVCLFLMPFIYAEENVSIKNQASSCLIDSQKIMEELNASGFFIVRVNDSLNEGSNLFDAQVVLEEKKRKYDFSLVIPYCEEIENIRINAYQARDEFQALLKFYEESFVEGMDISKVNITLNQIKYELESERYEQVSDLVNQGYNEIIDSKSDYTTLNIFYKSTSRGVSSFLKENWISILVVILFASLLLLIYKTSISRWLIKRKMAYLDMRKATLKKLIMKTQKEYFESGKISEATYNIRINKFGQLIRDIDRQIPLLNEELVKIARKGGKQVVEASPRKLGKVDNKGTSKMDKKFIKKKINKNKNKKIKSKSKKKR